MVAAAVLGLIHRDVSFDQQIARGLRDKRVQHGHAGARGDPDRASLLDDDCLTAQSFQHPENHQLRLAGRDTGQDGDELVATHAPDEVGRP